MTDLSLPERIKAFFESNGYFAPLRLISAEEASELRARVEAFERTHPESVGLLDMKPNLLFPWLDRLSCNEHMLNALEAIIGPDILCENMAFRNKAADGKTYVSWHQDTPYLPIRPLIITTWLAITPATKANGCLRVIPGSHKWNQLTHKEKVDPDSMLTRGHYIAEPFDESQVIDIELEPGEALLQHFNIVHSSQPNHSNDRRMGLLIDCVPASAVKDGGREFAMVVRGSDTWNHFDHETPPVDEFGPAERAQHQKAVALVTQTFYSGSNRVPEALSGKARNRM